MHDVLDILDLCMGGKGVSAIFILMFISYTRKMAVCNIPCLVDMS